MAPNHKPAKKTAVAEKDEDRVSTGTGELESDEESAAADGSHSGEGQGNEEPVAARPAPEGPSMLTPSNDRSMVGQTRYSYDLATGSRDASVAWVASLGCLTTASTAPTTVAPAELAATEASSKSVPPASAVPTLPVQPAPTEGPASAVDPKPKRSARKSKNVPAAGDTPNPTPAPAPVKRTPSTSSAGGSKAGTIAWGVERFIETRAEMKGLVQALTDRVDDTAATTDACRLEIKTLTAKLKRVEDEMAALRAERNNIFDTGSESGESTVRTTGNKRKAHSPRASGAVKRARQDRSSTEGSDSEGDAPGPAHPPARSIIPLEQRISDPISVQRTEDHQGAAHPDSPKRSRTDARSGSSRAEGSSSAATYTTPPAAAAPSDVPHAPEQYWERAEENSLPYVRSGDWDARGGAGRGGHGRGGGGSRGGHPTGERGGRGGAWRGGRGGGDRGRGDWGHRGGGHGPDAKGKGRASDAQDEVPPAKKGRRAEARADEWVGEPVDGHVIACFESDAATPAYAKAAAFVDAWSRWAPTQWQYQATTAYILEDGE
ncbi:hypothetical protein FB451DRAFT_1298100 [Mycena latifolia]|nr:hypothetical protein FB451DRAFT_1298100 [Mycena latifolia]